MAPPRLEQPEHVVELGVGAEVRERAELEVGDERRRAAAAQAAAEGRVPACLVGVVAAAACSASFSLLLIFLLNVPVDQQQLLDQNHPNDRLLVPRGVHGHSRVSRCHDRPKRRAVEPRVGRQRKDALDRREAALGGFRRKVERPADDRDLVDRQVAPEPFVLGVDVDERLELRSPEEGRGTPTSVRVVAAAEGAVEDRRERRRDRVADHHQHPHQPRRLRAHGQAVPRADRLRDHLAEEQHDGHRERDGRERRGEAVEEDRECLGGEGVAEDKGHEEEVRVLYDLFCLVRVLKVKGREVGGGWDERRSLSSSSSSSLDQRRRLVVVVAM